MTRKRYGGRTVYPLRSGPDGDLYLSTPLPYAEVAFLHKDPKGCGQTLETYGQHHVFPITPVRKFRGRKVYRCKLCSTEVIEVYPHDELLLGKRGSLTSFGLPLYKTGR